jgi:transposase-like protein
MKNRYTEEQIIKAIREYEAGAKVDDICRELSISTGTLRKDQASRLSFELSGKSTSRTHLNTPPWMVGYHLKTCPKLINHYKNS